MTNIKNTKLILVSVILLLSIMLSGIVYISYQKQFYIIINTHLELEANIIQEASRISQLWFDKRRREDGVTISLIEQEVLTNFIGPISILENGDAWIYNRDYVVFDKSSDFPDEYRGKSMRQIFDIQSTRGAYHYEELTRGVENATQGKGWYVWLPEKGKEWVAWTSFRILNKTWTIGLSTPQEEILANYGLRSFLWKQILYVLLIILILIGISILILKYQKKQKQLLQKVNEANTSLKNIDSLKNDFFTNITHDFRTPLSIIFNLAELNLSEAKDLTPNVREDLDIIYHTSYKFLSKINTLLDLTKIETTGLRLQIKKVKLVDFLSQTAEFYSSLLKYSGIDIQFLDHQKSSGFCYTDAEKLEDIINNFMSNAIKAITNKKGRIEIELYETEDYGEIKISDNGQGIEKEHLEIIFDRFEQIETDDRKSLGSGIGLAYCKQLADQLGGAIRVESPGKGLGAVFTLRINKNHFSAYNLSSSENEWGEYVPTRMIFDADNKNLTKPVISITDTNRQNEFNQFKGIILIVDDEPVIRDIIIRYLKSSGYRNFITADNGESALKMIKIYHPDLVITDYSMPEMDGDEFYARIHSTPEYDFIPFIFISALADEEIIKDQKKRGAVDFLVKPLKREDLLISVDSNLKKYMDFYKISAIDDLTRLLNRRTFLKNFENMLLNPPTSDLSLILLDLDYFKTVNDTYGHQAGDYVLSRVCSKILDLIRSQDIAGRYGGEEFAILLPETGVKQAGTVAEKIRSEIGGLTLYFQGDEIHVTVSMGISSLGQFREIHSGSGIEDNCILEMIRMSDTALYQAKSDYCSACGLLFRNVKIESGETCSGCGGTIENGRNAVAVYQPEIQPILSK